MRTSWLVAVEYFSTLVQAFAIEVVQNYAEPVDQTLGLGQLPVKHLGMQLGLSRRNFSGSNTERKQVKYRPEKWKGSDLGSTTNAYKRPTRNERHIRMHTYGTKGNIGGRSSDLWAAKVFGHCTNHFMKDAGPLILLFAYGFVLCHWRGGQYKQWLARMHLDYI